MDTGTTQGVIVCVNVEASLVAIVALSVSYTSGPLRSIDKFKPEVSGFSWISGYGASKMHRLMGNERGILLLAV